MPKVYLPLGSAAASGQFGEMIVFQGTNVRSYVVPVDPRSDAQLDVRHLFYDVTKIMRTLGLLGKGLLAAYKGPRWYTDSYKRVSENAAARLIAEGVNWDAFTEPQKEEWRAAAPFVATYNDPGEMYFCIGRILNDWIEPITGADFLGVFPNPTTAAAYRAAWDVGLDDVVTLSKTNDDDDRVVYSGTWSVQSDSSAFGGNYHKTSTPNSECFFYFTGNQISLGFVGLTNGGTLQAEFSDGEAMQIDQYRAVATYGLAAVKNFLTGGVHWVRLGFFGSGTQVVNLDSIDGAKIKGALPAVPGNEISHSAMDDLLNDDHPQYFNQVRGDARYVREAVRNDGWVIASGWSRASVAAINVLDGSIFDKGDKIYIETTTPTARYFYVVEITGNVLSLLGDISGVENAIFAIMKYSKVETPNGFAQWFMHQPNYANCTETTLTASRYKIIGQMVFWEYFGLVTMNSSPATLAIRLTPPLLNVNDIAFNVPVSLGGVYNMGFAQFARSLGIVGIFKNPAAENFLANANVTIFFGVIYGY